MGRVGTRLNRDRPSSPPFLLLLLLMLTCRSTQSQPPWVHSLEHEGLEGGSDYYDVINIVEVVETILSWRPTEENTE